MTIEQLREMIKAATTHDLIETQAQTELLLRRARSLRKKISYETVLEEIYCELCSRRTPVSEEIDNMSDDELLAALAA